MTCREVHGAVVCGPSRTKVIGERPAGIRWCFQCRKRVPFTDSCRAEVEPSYYEPNWQRACPKGHLDGDLFPGNSREWTYE